MNHLSCLSLNVFSVTYVSLVLYIDMLCFAICVCAHKNLFSCKVLTVRKYITFCAVITSLYWWCFFKYLSFSVCSYFDVTIRYSNSYRRYNTDIPQFLCNRPQEFIKHCLLKISLAENIDLSGIINTGGGNFTIVSFPSNSKQRYELCFGDTCSMPKCSCNDWCRTGYLCKHFFAIFKKYPAMVMERSFQVMPQSAFTCSRLRHWCRSGIFIVTFEHISHLVLVLLLLTLNK